jgi:YHS domain-containing protein
MKQLKNLNVAALAIVLLSAPLVGLAAEAKKDAKAKPYPLTTCLVSDEKLGEMGEAYVFTHEGQEIKLCCKSCLKDFNKNPKKYTDKLAKAKK